MNFVCDADREFTTTKVMLSRDVRHLGVEKDRVVVGVMKLQVVVELESAVFPPDLVQARDPILDIAGCIPVPFFELIFFRVEIFSRPGNA